MKEQKQIVIQLHSDKKSSKKSTAKKNDFEVIDLEKITELNNDDINSKTVKNNIDFYNPVIEITNQGGIVVEVENEDENQPEIEPVVQNNHTALKKPKNKIFSTYRVIRTPPEKPKHSFGKLKEIFVNNIDDNLLNKKRHYTKLKSLERSRKVTQTTIFGFLK
jgi:hypothetical protein